MCCVSVVHPSVTRSIILPAQVTLSNPTVEMNTVGIDWRYGLKTHGNFPAIYSLTICKINKYNIQ